MDMYVIDTHGLVWFMTLDTRLSNAAQKILEQAEADETQVLIPTIVLAECMYIAQKKRVEIGIEKILQRIEKWDEFSVASLDLTVFQMTIFYNLFQIINLKEKQGIANAKKQKSTRKGNDLLAYPQNSGKHLK